ncbi:MAG: hypothetical protein KatS3mg126_0516 [Lysobacteraceae bacterium]|nr:MAG: hypothetical protein KatS3mg126_0516 [Xanthomonadaceae bacterium]
MVLAGQRRAATRVRGTRSLGRRGLVLVLLPCLLAAAGHAQPGPSPAPEPALLPEGGMVWQVPVEEGLAVEIEHALGRVQVQGGAPGRIVLRARPSVAGVELRIVREPGVLKLATQGRRDDAGTPAAGAPPASLVAGELEVDVPPGHAVRLRATSAQIEVDGLRAPELTIGLLAGSLRVRAELARLRLDLVQASAELDLGRLEQADLATVSGLAAPARSGAQGRVQVRSVSAGLDLDPGTLAEALRIETVAGPVRLAVAPGPGAASRTHQPDGRSVGSRAATCGAGARPRHRTRKDRERRRHAASDRRGRVAAASGAGLGPPAHAGAVGGPAPARAVRPPAAG